jgi:hypothetical protein
MTSVDGKPCALALEIELTPHDGRKARCERSVMRSSAGELVDRTGVLLRETGLCSCSTSG